MFHNKQICTLLFIPQFFSYLIMKLKKKKNDFFQMHESDNFKIIIFYFIFLYDFENLKL